MLGCAKSEKKRLWTIVDNENGRTGIMSSLDLQLFIDNPTFDKFDKCRKDDLLKIATITGSLW